MGRRTRSRSATTGLCTAVLLALVLALLPGAPAVAQATCSVPQTQTHRGILGTFDQCLNRSFDDGGTTYTVHVYYTETTTPADAVVCSADADDDGTPDLPAGNCEHALSDVDDGNGDQVDAVIVADETVAAWQFYRTLANPVPIVSGTDLNVFIGEDARGGGIPTCASLWWDDEWVDGGNVLTMRVLAYHEAFHLAQFCQYDQASGSHGEGVARAIEDRVDAALDANLGDLFIPEVRQHLSTEGPGTPAMDGSIPSPRARGDALDDQWYWSMAWWTYLFDQTAAGDSEPSIGWEEIDELYDLMASNDTDVGAADDLLASRGSSFGEAFRRYGQALFAYPYAPSDPALRFIDAEITTATGPLSGHIIRNGAPAVQADSFTMNPRSNRHIEYRPGATCTAVTFEFDGNGQSYGWAALGVEDPVLDTRAEAFGPTWAATVLVGDLDRIAGVVTSTGASGPVDVESGCTQPTLEIERPTTAVPAIVGEATDPRRVLARVDVDGPTGEPVQGLSADAFEVVLRREGTELAATVLSAAEVQSDYWLLLDLPDEADGAQTGLAYDLLARLAGAEAVQATSVLYAEQPDRDLVVVTDQSGSMSTDDKIDAARNAGELLVEEMTDDDQAGYAAFDEVAVVREPLGPLGVADHRDDVQDAIRAEVPDGATSIGAGMQAAATEHDVRGADDHACSFVLLSDGAENSDPRWADVIGQVTDNGCPLHVVGLGPGANEPLLQQIAGAVPGGSYDYAGTGADGFAFAQAGGATTWQNGLAAIYDLAATRIGDRERLLSTGFDTPPPAMACLDEIADVDFSDATPQSITEGEQLTAGGVTFDSLRYPGATVEGSAEVTDADEVFFDHLTLQASDPACRVELRVRIFNAAAELRVNGESHTFSNLAAVDGEVVGGVTVDVQELDTSGGFQTGTIVLAGNLTSYGFGGTRTVSQEFPGQVFLQDVQIQRGEPGGIPIVVDPTTERLVVTASSQTPVPGALSQLYRPDGSPQPISSAGREPHGSAEVWTVIAPPPGEWRLLINDQFTSPGLVTASAVSDLTLELLLQPTADLVDAAVTGVEIPIVAAFSGQGGPIVGGDVSATVTDPTGFATTMTLHDDGAHGDGAADDGFYGGSHTATSFGDVTVPDPVDGEEPEVAGSYRVDVVGTSGPDRREDSGSFALAQDEDADDDGLPDGWEVAHGLDPADPSDATGDGDRDGLPVICELQSGTDPRTRDTDGGGGSDGTEVVIGAVCRPGPTDPLDPDDDRISSIVVLTVEPEVDDDGNPIVVLTWGDPQDDGHVLIDVDIWCQPLDPETLQPTGPWQQIASDVEGTTYIHTDVADGEVLHCQVDPTVDGGDGPLDGSTQTSGPVVVSDDPHPPEGTVLIDGGAVTTPDEVVDLELTVDDLSAHGHGGPPDGPGEGTVNGSAPADIEMRLANGPTVPESTPWVPFSATVEGWELDPDTTGLAIVSVQYRDATGNVGAGGLFMKDTILVEGRRLQGPSRIETAVDISQNDFAAGGADAVVIARSELFPDAVAGAPLAVARNAPILLTPRDSLHPATAAEITRVLLPGAPVYVLGGTAAITDETAAAIAALGYPITRVAGPARVETAVEIARELGAPETLLLANGDTFPDPLVAGAAAPTVDGAVLLTGNGVPAPATDAYLASRPDATVYAIGGPAAAAYPDATPVVGTTADETAVAVAERFHTDPTVVGIARNDEFPDALAGGAHIARGGGPMLLTDSGALSDVTAGYLCANRTSVVHHVIYGGVLAISDAVLGTVAARLGGDGC